VSKNKGKEGKEHGEESGKKKESGCSGEVEGGLSWNGLRGWTASPSGKGKVKGIKRGRGRSDDLNVRTKRLGR